MSKDLKVAPFQAYKSGVFNACTGEKPNHAINIIGWDDAGGYWIVRNSWGSDWGESGYIKVKYGCSKIGSTSAVPRLPNLLNCARGNCQSSNSTSPPWLKASPPNTVPSMPPIEPPINPMPPYEPLPMPSNDTPLW